MQNQHLLPDSPRSFASAYLSLALILTGIGFWNSDRLLSRSEFLSSDTQRVWAAALLDTLAPESTRLRLKSIQQALSSEFPLAPKIQLATQAAPIIQVQGSALQASSLNTSQLAPTEIQHIFFAGDSLANGYAAGAARALHESKSNVKSFDEGKISTGLVSKSYFDWQRKVEDLCKKKPGAFVFSFGSNDPMDMRSGASVLRFGTEEWSSAYSERATNIVSAAKACGAKTVWLSLPPMREMDMQKKAKRIHAAQEKACRLADVCIQPFSPLPNNLSESYQERAKLAGKDRLLRAQDGIHMAPDGYYAVASQALNGLGVAPLAFSDRK